MEFPSLKTPAVIAMKGLPCTHKTHVAQSIASWAGTAPILLIDDFLDGLYPQEGDNGGGSSLATDKADRLHRLAFDILCKVATSHTSIYLKRAKCVVIKSRLCSTFELDRLIQVFGLKITDHRSPNPLIIIECQMRNELRWKRLYNVNYPFYARGWYRPKRWNEVEMAKNDYDAQAEAWDSHFLQSWEELPHEHRNLVRRLVLDVSTDNVVDRFSGEMTRPFADVVEYLLAGDKEELDKLSPVVEYDKLRRFLLEKELNAPRERSEYLCSTELGCVFKYWEGLEDHCICGVCEKQVSGPGYACHFCTLALHKSCAEDVIVSHVVFSDRWREHFPERHACKSCRDGGKGFSHGCLSCLFLTHLKCGLMPTIIKHDSHPDHFLSVQLDDLLYRCKACGLSGDDDSYACKICNYKYHLVCVLRMPREAKHEHGGYEHVMKLMYSLDGMEEEEDFWCDFCYEDMDRQLWFYSCLECPYYIAHVDINTCLPCRNIAGPKRLKE